MKGSSNLFQTILDSILSKLATLKAVAFSGSYNDLSDKPTIPDISTKVSKSGDTMSGKLNIGSVSTSYGDALEIRSASGTGTNWPLALKNAYSKSGYSTGWGTGIKLANGSETETGKWAGIRSVASSSYSNATALGFYADAAERMRLTSNSLLPLTNGIYHLGSSTQQWADIYAPYLHGKADNAATADYATNNVLKAGDTMTGALSINAAADTPLNLKRTNGSAASNTYLSFSNANGGLGYFGVNGSKKPVYCPSGGTDDLILTRDVNGRFERYSSDVGFYETNDTHWLKLGSMKVEGSDYLTLTLLITCDFYGNQHYSSDIITFCATRSSGTLAVNVTQTPINFNHTGVRFFAYITDSTNNLVNLYVYVTGGNSYGQWSVQILESEPGYGYWTNDFKKNQTLGSYYGTSRNDSVISNEDLWLCPGYSGTVQVTRVGTTGLVESTYRPIKASAFTVSSSQRFKKNVEDMTGKTALNILKLRPVTFDYIDEENGTNCEGLIAEEAAEIDQFQVLYDSEGRPDSIDYSKFVPQLIKLCQMQQEQIEMQQTQIDRLEERVKILESK